MTATNREGRPLKFESVEELKERIASYFQNMDEAKRPYTISGLALHLGTNRQTLINYEDRPEFFDTIKEAKAKCENYAEELLLTSSHATGPIFNLKNNYGWRDAQDHNIAGGITVQVTKYADNDKDPAQL